MKLAHALLAQATRLDPQNEKAWIWRAGVAHDYAEAADCLQHVLSLNPRNKTAMEGLARLGIQSSMAETTIDHGNGSKPLPPAYHEAETVRSQSPPYHEAETVRSRSTEMRLTVPSADNSQPTNRNLQTQEGSVEVEVQLDQIDPMTVEQVEEIHIVTERFDDSVALPEADESSQILRVLIVDDSPTIRKLVSMTLGKHGYEVDSAADGMEALARINDHAPDLILLDITMPRMDGYQLCRTIKGNDSIDHIPIVMLTGKDGFMDKVRGRMVGSEAYLTKPFNPDELVRMVRQYVGSA
jgi:twitching motility two-component system response regulator PilG